MFGNRLENGSYDGAIGNIKNFKSDIAFVGFFIKDYGTDDVEFTSTVYQDQLCCMTLKAGKVPSALLPLLIFEKQLWVSFFLVYFVIAVFWCILRLLNISFAEKAGINLPSHISRASTTTNMLQIFIDSSMLIFNCPFRRFPKLQSERILIASICLFSLIVVAAFQSSLATVYTKPMYYKNIDTLTELDRSGMRIVSKYQGFMDDAFAPNTSVLTDRLILKMVWMENVSMLSRLQSHREAGFTRKAQFDITYKSKNFHLIKECPRKYRIAYLVPKGFALLEEINMNILQLVASGVVQKLIGDAQYKFHLQYYIQNRNIFTPPRKVFTLNELQSAFYVLFAGLVISCLYFVFEIIFQIMFNTSCSCTSI